MEHRKTYREAEFTKWLTKLDKIFNAYFGLGYEDFDDYDWFDCFDAGETPDKAFNDYLKFFDLLI